MKTVEKKFPEVAGLGTLLRHLIEIMDGDVEQIYKEQGLDCRSRFTPVIRHIQNVGPSSIKTIALASGLTHSATSQTITEMLKKGLVVSEPGEDGRERIISLSAKGQAMMPKLRKVWSAIGEADAELAGRGSRLALRSALSRTIEALEEISFRDRIASHLPRNKS